MLTRAVRTEESERPTWGGEWGIVLRKPRLRKALIKLLINSKAHVVGWESRNRAPVQRNIVSSSIAISFPFCAQKRDFSTPRLIIGDDSGAEREDHLWAGGSRATMGKLIGEKRRSNWAHDK
jgi:hypothetical protein